MANVRTPIVTSAAALLALGGCRSYSPQPLDAAAHRRAWVSRVSDEESVAAFATRLEGTRPDTDSFDVSDGLSLNEAEAVALVFNPDLRLARLRANVASAGAETAGLWDDPSLGVDLEHILQNVENPWVVSGTLGLTIPLSGRLGAERTMATAEHRAELTRVAAQEWATRLALRTAWMEWSAQRARNELSRDLAAGLDEVFSSVDRLAEAGEISRLEAGLFRVERARRRGDLALAEARERELALGLLALMGLAPGASLTLTPERLEAPALDAGSSETALEQRNLSLAVLCDEYEVAEQALRLEVREQYPDLTIRPGLGSDEGDSRALLGISLPIPLWNRNRRGVAEAEAGRDLARAAFETEYERLSGALAAAETRLAAAAAARGALETEVAPLVDEQFAQSRTAAEAGEIDALVLLETLTRLNETKAALIDARLAEALAALRVEELIGPMPPNPDDEPAEAPDTGETP